ncbi:Odorant receptor Or2 [Eufriesea mexicana]|uniref:Odorant receptor Or2 n=1 Tax=Eufriesea mexicana TaxID=516756 RepID=A0A310STS8_9HYME|nr:Odorant receptor Or2 [Eufriesea mexicana]
MSTRKVRDLSVSVTSFYMKFVGYWLATNYVEKQRRNIAMSYTLFTTLFSMSNEMRALYFSWGDMNDSIYVMCNIVTVVLVTVKLLDLFIYIEELHDLINYANKNFWHSNYDAYEQSMIDNCKRTCIIFVCTFIFFAQGTAFSFVITPVLGCMCQLLMFTYSCDCLIRDSMDVSNAAYESAWFMLPMDKYGKMLRRDLTLVAMRSQIPCCLTANGFFVVSLETYTNGILVHVYMDDYIIDILAIKCHNSLKISNDSTFSTSKPRITKEYPVPFPTTPNHIISLLHHTMQLQKHTAQLFFRFNPFGAEELAAVIDSWYEKVFHKSGCTVRQQHMKDKEAERKHPFNLWINLPLSVTPYYEITFVIQTISMCCIGICYFCFDNIFCIMAIHLGGQFRILRYRFAKLCDTEHQICEKNTEAMLMKQVHKFYEKLKTCIRLHQSLINFCNQLETVYTMIILGQVLVFSMLICLFGYQVLLANAPPTRRIVFVFLLIGSMSLLFMFTYSCNGVIEHSDDIAIGAYSSLWTVIPMNTPGKKLRDDLIMVIVRARRVCCLTANGFFPVSLETYTTFLLRLTGTWMNESNTEESRRRFAMSFTIALHIYSLYINLTDMYYTLDDLNVTNIGKNKSDRALPFKVWVDLPLSVTPYYEIAFATQVIALQQIGATYACHCNFLCVLNMHAIYQFRMLQRKLSSLWKDFDKETNSIDYTNNCYTALKECIRRHQLLIKFCEKLKYVYMLPILSDVVVFSILMCLNTYEILLFLLRLTGMWMKESNTKESRRTFAMTYTIALHIYALYINLTDIYYTWGDMNVTNIGRNKSDRVHPIKMWFDLPLSETPYFEIVFATQVIALQQIGATYVCHYNFSCVLNMHAIYQFRMLQRKLSSLWKDFDKETNSIDYTNNCYTALKECIRRHQLLIKFCEKLKYVYMLPILSDVVVFSILMCLNTYEILLFLLRLTGTWMNESNTKESRRRFAMSYTILLHVYAMYINLTDVYYTWGDLNSLTLQQIGATYVCHDNFLCVMNMHVIYQFRVLQRKLSNLWKDFGEQTNSIDFTENCYIALKECIKQHQLLIEFCEKLKFVYMLPILSDVVAFSILMCLHTYEILLADVSILTRFISIFHIAGNFTYIIFFTYVCHGLMEESTNIGMATYSVWWEVLPMTESGRKLRKDMRIMIMKSLQPCYLSAGGFFPVTLQTSTAKASASPKEEILPPPKSRVEKTPPSELAPPKGYAGESRGYARQRIVLSLGPTSYGPFYGQILSVEA